MDPKTPSDQLNAKNISLIASFDDLCRYQGSISSNEHEVYKAFTKALQSCETLRTKYVALLKDFDNLQQKAFILQDENDEYRRKLEIVEDRLEKAWQNNLEITAKYENLKSKIKEFLNSTIDSPENNTELLDRLNRLRTINFDTNTNYSQPYAGVYDDVDKKQISEAFTIIEPLRTLSNVDSSKSDSLIPDSFNGSDAIITSSSPNSDHSHNFSNEYISEDASSDKSVDKSNSKVSSDQTTVIYKHDHDQPLAVHLDENFSSVIDSNYHVPLDTGSDGQHIWQKKIAFTRESTCAKCNNRIELFSRYAYCNECRFKLHINCIINLNTPCIRPNQIDSSSCSRSLMDFVTSNHKPKVPNIMLICCAEIEKRGSNITGIYKYKRSDRLVEKTMLDILYPSNGELNLSKINEMDIHLLCNIVIYFLQYLVDLDDSLIPRILWNDLILVTFRSDLKLVEEIIARLPSVNRDTLAFLMIHLRKVFENERSNKVSKKELTRIFAPKVIQLPELVGEKKKYQELQAKMMNVLLEISSDFWQKTLDLETPESSPSSTDRDFVIDLNGDCFQSPVSQKTNASVYGTPMEAPNRRFSVNGHESFFKYF